MNRETSFWLPASNYYVLAFAVSGAFFFILWGISHDFGDDTPWITAGAGATILLAGTVVTREFLLRVVRRRTLSPRRPVQPVESRRTGKLTIEGNTAILREITQKSEAANVLTRFSAGHREVYELCAEYISRNESELKSLSAASPRLAPLLRGRTTAAELHKYHLLRWAEIEARNLTTEASKRTGAVDRINAAQDALEVIESALDAYPAERSLLESRDAVEDMVVSIKVTELVGAAERLAFDGRYGEGLMRYRDALFELAQGNSDTADRAAAADRIRTEIEKLEQLGLGS